MDVEDLIEMIGEDIVLDPELLLEFIVQNDMGESLVDWCRSNLTGDKY